MQACVTRQLQCLGHGFNNWGKSVHFLRHTDLSPQHHLDWHPGPFRYLSNGYPGLLHYGYAAKRSPPSSIIVNIHPCVFTIWCLIKQGRQLYSQTQILVTTCSQFITITLLFDTTYWCSWNTSWLRGGGEVEEWYCWTTPSKHRLHSADA